MSHNHTAKRNVSRSTSLRLGLALFFGLALALGLLGAFSLDGAHKRSAYAAPPNRPALQSSQATTTTITSDQPDPSLVGESVLVSFTVAAGSSAPTGTVTVTLNMGTYTGTLGFGKDVCTDTLTEGPSVTSTGACTLTPQVTGTGTLSATYGGEGDFESSLDTEPHRVTDSDLSITKTAEPDPATAGRSLVYTLTIANQGSMSATNVTISDTLPPSLTLHSVDQTDDNGGAFSFLNGTHWNTEWYTGRPATGEDDWLRIANTVTPTGVYTSSVLDGYNLVEWSSLSWVPRRPYGKPLPDGGQTESAYDRGNANMTGNAVLLHLDTLYSAAYPTGTVMLPPSGSGTMSDTSGLTTPVACPAAPDQGENCPSVTGDGRFVNAFDFDGAFSHTVVISDATDPARYALELWVRPQAVTDTSLILRANAAYTDTARRYSHILGIVDGHFRHTVYDGEYRTITGTTPVTVGTWYHLVGTAQSGGELELYVNGEREARMGGLDALWTGGDHYRLGSAYSFTRTTECLSGTLRFPCPVTDTVQYFSGTLDEVAIYSRTLSSAEIRDHYLRGALQLQLEARSCDQADCANGNEWKGPYSEADNDSLELPEAAIDVPNNRYFQYRTTLTTTEDTSYSPELHSVTVHPGHRAVTATQGSCWAAYHSFTCTLGTLSSGQVVTVSTGANIHHAALGVITNTASVTAPGEVITANNTVALTTTVGAEADLVILKHDDETEMDSDTDDDWDVGGRDPVNPGSTLTYTLRVRNGGPSTARWVTVTDQLPAGLTGYASGDGWTCGPPSNTVTCTLESLSPTYSWREQYDWEHIVITATAPITEGVITNTAWITSATFETITHTAESNRVTETTSIEPVADVSVEKRDYPDPVDPGATLTYAITVTNHGPYTATGVVVTDTLPDGLEGHVVDGGDWSCGVSDVFTCALQYPLTPTLSASFNVTVTAPMSGFLANYVHVTAEQYDPDDDNNWDAAYTAVRPVADLFVSKHDTPDPVNAAAPLTYTVIVTNTGPVDAGAFSTTVEASNGHDFRIHPRGGRAAPYRTSIYLSSVPGLLRDLTVTLHDVSHSYPSDLSLLLVGPDERAVVLMANAGGGSDVDDLTLTFNDDGVAVDEPITSTVVRPTNNGFSEDFEPPAPAGPYGSSLSTFYNADPNGRWRLYVYDTVYSDGGSIGGWSLEVTGSTTDTVTLSDTLPAELSGVNVTSPSGWDCGAGTDPLMCEADWLPVDAPAVFTVTATAPITGGPLTSFEPSVITNTAAITSTIADLGPHTNTATITTTVAAVADLGISKRVVPSDVVDPGAPLTYTLTVSNAGPSPLLTPLVVTDTLPAGLTDVSASGADWTCDALTPTMTCTRTDGLGVGLAPDIVISATAPLTPETVLTNTAGVTATVIDPASVNNSAAVTVTVAERADLQIVKSAQPTALMPDAVVTYTLSITNAGPSVARDVLVSDTLVNAASMGTPSAPSEWDTCGQSGDTFTCTASSLKVGAAADIVVTATALSGQSIITNTAEITGSVVDPDDTNNADVITVAVSQPPTITVPSDAYATDEDTTKTITFTVGDPDTQLDQLTLTYTISNTTLISNVVLGGSKAERTVTLTPATDLNGHSLVTVTVSDGVLSDSDVFTLTVNPVNDPPVALNDVYTTAEDTTLTVTATHGLLENDDDIDGDRLTTTLENNVSSGTLALDADGSFVYTPTANFSGHDDFTYILSDSGGLTDTATVSITVTAVNDPPVAAEDAYTTLEDTTLMVTATDGLLENDDDVDGDELTTTLESDVFSGTLALDADGSFAYTPTADFNGSDKFTYILSDGSLTDTATVAITVTAVNDPPTITVPLDAYATDEDVTKVISFTVGDPDTALDSLSLTATLSNETLIPLTNVALGGTDAERTVTLTPTANLHGQSLVTLTVSDGDLSDSDTFTLTVSSVSDPPTITVPLDAYETDEDVTAVITFTVGDPDTALDSLDLTRSTSNEALIPSGNVALSGTGAERTVTLTPTANLHGQSRVNLTVSDGDLIDSDIFTLTVKPVNDPPAFTSAPVEQAIVGETYVYTVTADDVDVGDVLTVTAPISPTWLSLTGVNTRTARLSGTPDEAHLGDQSVALLVRDTGALTDTQPFTITVRRGTYSIYLPLVLRNYVTAPDLVVDDIVATSDAITVTISNQGDATITATVENEFWLDVYLNPSSAPTYNQTWAHLCDEGLIWGITQDALPLTPGDTLTLTTSRYQDGPYYRPNESEITWPLPVGTEVWAQVDSTNQDTDYGAVLENHEIIGAPYEEGGNVMGPVTSTADAAGQETE